VKLAKTMVGIGEGVGKKTTAFITGMAQPLGFAVGNALEVKESIDTLNGSGPADLTALVLTLGSEMLLLSGIGRSHAEARAMLKSHIANKKGARKLQAFIEAQGGDPQVVENTDLLPRSRTRIPFEADTSGFVQGIDALEIGMAAKILGAGRQTKEDAIDLSIGVVLLKKVGDPVRKGEPLAVLHSDGDTAKIDPAAKRLSGAYTIGPEDVSPPELILARIPGDSVKKVT
jgi:pyrimidine-nucleoside phosphorylase